MKKVACHQMQIVSEDEFHLISGGDGHWTVNLQTALSGDQGCVAGANAARGNNNNNNNSNSNWNGSSAPGFGGAFGHNGNGGPF